MKRVLLTLSGKVRLNSSSEIWSRVANVMKAAGANIETAGGTFVQIPQGREQDDSSFSVSAFGACISPSLLSGGGAQGPAALLGCTMYLKAILPEDRVPVMMRLLQTQSPLQVYTFCLSRDAGKALPGRPHWNQESRQQAGIIYLFGLDRPGQLARVTETLSRFGVTVMHLRVHSLDQNGAIGGPFAENRIRVVFDEASLDLPLLRREIQRIGEEVGYAVTCITTDAQTQLRAWMSSYLLKRRAFSICYLEEKDKASSQRSPPRGFRAPRQPSRGVTAGARRCATAGSKPRAWQRLHVASDQT